MMDIQEPDLGKFFCTGINLAERIRGDRPLRKIAGEVDFSFIYRVMADKYCSQGQRFSSAPGGSQTDAAFGLLQRPIRAGAHGHLAGEAGLALVSWF
jgi:hypothetical protein